MWQLQPLCLAKSGPEAGYDPAGSIAWDSFLDKLVFPLAGIPKKKSSAIRFWPQTEKALEADCSRLPGVYPLS